MIRAFKRLNSKKGFTLVELMVVIAIIGVLIAMIVPALTYDNKPTIAKAAAKDVYYVAQDSMSSLKVSSPTALSGMTGGATFYVDVDRIGEVVECGILTGGRKSFDSLMGTLASDLDLNDKQRMYDKLKGDFENYITSVNDLIGTYYVNVDENFRVTEVYWTDAPAGTNLTNNTSYEDEYRIDGYYCLAYPAERCMAGQMFSYHQ